MSINPKEYKVALLAGGTSGEREISIKSGEGARSALETAGFDVTWIDPAEKEDIKRLLDEHFDVAFLCTHGKGGEDGTLQGMLELFGIPYTCPGVQASAIAMDKSKSKILYEHAGISTSPWMVLYKSDGYDIEQIKTIIGAPCVVKAATEGSSIGVVIVQTEDQLESAIEEVFEIDDVIVVEKFITGPEFTCVALGNNDAHALPVIQIVPLKGATYDFESKYADGGSKHICPAPLDDEQTKLIQDSAVKAHKALGCRGVSRSDFIIDADGKAWILETNTIPGMTATSLLPDAAKAAGISFPDLCTQLIEFALE